MTHAPYTREAMVAAELDRHPNTIPPSCFELGDTHVIHAAVLGLFAEYRSEPEDSRSRMLARLRELSDDTSAEWSDRLSARIVWARIIDAQERAS